ncbi:DUF3263 domain-containing protein [Thermocrispum municipale]|jgi:hypothetical protein|uniref:DUF3263 domain-containing protein n=1 Tax=Thermocrispum municipale TaxID=37926 RepID=UPI000416C24D|nr:DUF3263 domain-containing protein [Thermocrispum municipale]
MDAAESMPRREEAASAVAPVLGDPRGPAAAELSELEQRILAFERQWWQYAGAKEKAIREQFGMSSTRYYQLLNRLLDTERALRADPMLVKRLRKTRAARKRKRSARRLGIEL